MDSAPLPLDDGAPAVEAYAPTIAPPPTKPQERAVGRAGHREPAPTGGRPPGDGRWRALWRAWGPFLAVVIAPTLVVAAYYGLLAAPQYQSEAHFMVRANEPSYGPTTGLGAALGLGGNSNSQAEAHGVNDYLQSHDAVAALGRVVDLPAVFRRPEADVLSRLWSPHPQPETLLKYYRRQVKVAYGSDSGITTLTVRAFRPVDARQIADSLLALGEARVNTFNQRALDNSLAVAKTQLREAEVAVAAAQTNLTGLRQGRRDIDPERTGAAQITLASTLQEQLALARAQLASMSQSVSADSPQRVALAQQVQALEAQVGAARARSAGPPGATAQDLGAFEGLKLRQEFAAKRYEAAATALQSAREQAQKQQLFVVRVVDPDLPVKSLYPERLKIVATVFLGLLLAYSIGWLVLAGVREHAL